MSDKINNSIIKFPKKLFFLYINIYLIPFFVSWITFVKLDIFDLKETLIGFTSPVAIIGVLLIYGFILFWWFSQTKLIKNFNPNDSKSIERTNKISKRFQTVTLATGVLNAFFFRTYCSRLFCRKTCFC